MLDYKSSLLKFGGILAPHSCLGDIGHFLQEILDQIADIDLVLNFKCTEECTSVHRSPLCPKVKPQDEELISADLAWKERFAFYAEEVGVNLFGFKI